MAGSYNYPRDVHVRTYMSGMPAYHCIVQCCARANQKNMRMRTPQILRPTWSINTTVALMGRRSIVYSGEKQLATLYIKLPVYVLTRINRAVRILHIFHFFLNECQCERPDVWENSGALYR